MSSTTIFTCVTCNVAFCDADIQREHYKTDWHRYNLKRKVAELPPVNFENFQEKVQQQKMQETAQSQRIDEMFCKLCQKHFTSNSHANHVQSNRHRELVKSATAAADQEFIVKSDRTAKKAAEIQKQLQQQQQEIVEEEAVDDKDWEDVAGDTDTDMFNEADAIEPAACLFCEHKSDTVVAKCEHMAREHSFFVPDNEHVCDLEGLMKFLGVKVGAYHVCLWCSNKVYRDLDAVQKHMRDKGHQKMRFEGDTLLEYVDFYEFDNANATLDDEDYDIVNHSLDITIISSLNSSGNEGTLVPKADDLEDETFELVLPSGARIGHRSLFRYYKQSFGQRSLELKAKSNVTLRDKYKAISSNGNYTQVEIQRQRKDMAYFQRWSARQHVKLGWKANKLITNLRRQDITF